MNEKPLTSPLEVQDKSLFRDASDHAGVEGEALRVELRRVRDPATGKPTQERKLVDPNFLIGIISPEELPIVGEVFNMSYHNYNNLSDFGKITSHEKLQTVTVIDDCYFFSTKDGEWRLRVLKDSN